MNLKQLSPEIINEFITLNHLLSSHIAGIGSSFFKKNSLLEGNLCELNKTLGKLNDSLQRLEIQLNNKPQPYQSFSNSEEECGTATKPNIKTMNTISSEINELIKKSAFDLIKIFFHIFLYNQTFISKTSYLF